jgi:RHS repeat-associated protein
LLFENFIFSRKPLLTLQSDHDLFLYYNRARYLDVNRGRFRSYDNFEGVLEDTLSIHKYSYTANNPIDNVDPLGLFTLTDIQVSSVVSSVLTAVARHSIQGAIGGAIFGGVDAALGGGSSEDIINGALQGGKLGGVLGPIASLKAIQPALILLGVTSSILGTYEAAESGNNAQAGFRGILGIAGAFSLLSTFKTNPTSALTAGNKPKTFNSNEEVQGLYPFLRSINPDNSKTNCVLCAYFIDRHLAGRPPRINCPTCRELEIPVLENLTGRAFRDIGGESLINLHLRTLGNGARGIIFVKRPDGSGHVYNVVNEGGKVYFIDGQIGGAAVKEGGSFLFLQTYP